MKNKTIKVIVLALLCGLLGACSESEPEYTDLEGNRFQFKDYRGQWLVVNYWAIWCAPCRKEVPDLNALDKRPDVSVLGIDWDASATELSQKNATAIGIEFRVTNEDVSPFLAISKPDVLPTTLILNPQGEVVAKLKGYQPLENLLEVLPQQ